MMLSKASSDLITLSESGGSSRRCLTFYSGALRGKLMMDLTGHVYGRLTVLSRAEKKNKRTAWNCQCSCGAALVVTGDAMRTGNTNSCGCLRTENKSSQGMGSITPEYHSWFSMIQRCTNTEHISYKRYGSAGVTVYAPWVASFQEFKKHIGPRPTAGHSIDRIDGSKGYEPGNVRWATCVEQSANRKNTALVDYKGFRQPLALLARAHGLDPKVVYARVVRLGWSVEKALTTPVNG